MVNTREAIQELVPAKAGTALEATTLPNYQIKFDRVLAGFRISCFVLIPSFTHLPIRPFPHPLAPRQAPLTIPVSCNAAELTAWALGHKLKTALAQSRSLSDTWDPTRFWSAAMPESTDLEGIHYEEWVGKKRAWFTQQFPWVFQLGDALEKEGVEVNYPELLVRSGDIWQFGYPEALPGRIPVINPTSLLKAASQYGFSSQWLTESLPESDKGGPLEKIGIRIARWEQGRWRRIAEVSPRTNSKAVRLAGEIKTEGFFRLVFGRESGQPSA